MKMQSYFIISYFCKEVPLADFQMKCNLKHSHWLVINSVSSEVSRDQSSRINSKLSENLPSHNEQTKLETC